MTNITLKEKQIFQSALSSRVLQLEKMQSEELASKGELTEYYWSLREKILEYKFIELEKPLPIPCGYRVRRYKLVE